ncbi:MAG: DoxX family membrane protein [Candidatus Eisenbacteria bacterium]|nr:DoxX family membrane protein [Candidatus Eisenbacteria bacterium]
MAFERLFTTTENQRNWGLLVLRLGVGFSMAAFHGYRKLMGGPELWTGLGGYMENLGIGFLPVFWGFMAMFAEFFGSLALMLGFFFRPAALLLTATMFVAVTRHLNLPPEADGAGWRGASHALELGAVFLGLFLAGPGKYSVDRLLRRGSS